MSFTITDDIELIVWDWNGTIYDDARICQDITNEQLIKLGLKPLSYETQEILFRHPVSEYYEAMGVTFSEGEFESLSIEFHRTYGKRRVQGSVRVDALSCLERFSERGLKQIVLSAYREAELQELVRECELTSYFDAILGLPDCHAISKVARGADWVRDQGIDCASVLIIGDTNHDLAVADALGAQCVLTPSGYQHENILVQTKAPVVHSLQEIELP